MILFYVTKSLDDNVFVLAFFFLLALQCKLRTRSQEIHVLVPSSTNQMCDFSYFNSPDLSVLVVSNSALSLSQFSFFSSTHSTPPIIFFSPISVPLSVFSLIFSIITHPKLQNFPEASSSFHPPSPVGGRHYRIVYLAPIQIFIASI